MFHIYFKIKLKLFRYFLRSPTILIKRFTVIFIKKIIYEKVATNSFAKHAAVEYQLTTNAIFDCAKDINLD